MKQASLFLVLLALIFFRSFSKDVLRVTDPYAVKKDVDSFTRVVLSGPFSVLVKQGKETGLAISSRNTKWRDAIHVEVKNGVLRVSEGRSRSIALVSSSSTIVYNSVKDLDSLSLSGVCSLTIDGQLTVERLGLYISGSSDMKGDIQACELMIRQSGASVLQVKGNVTKIDVQLSGASDVRAAGLLSNNCYAEISGASDMTICVSRKLQAKVSGASELHYSGDPAEANVRSTGGSTVRKINQ